MRCKQYDDGSDAHLAQGHARRSANSAQQKGGRACDRLFVYVIPGRQSRTWNLEILWCGSPHHSSMLRIAPERCSEASGLVEQGLDVFPVHEVLDERLEIIRTTVAVVDVVGVLPDVAAEDRGGAVHQRILAVRGLGDLELAVLDLEPGPARAELTDARRLEVRLELLEAAEVLVDLLLDLARQLGAAAIGLHP